MSGMYDLGGDVRGLCRKATMRTITGFILSRPEGLTTFGSRLTHDILEMYDAIGGWYFADLRLDEYTLLDKLMDELAADMPSVIAHWSEEWKPAFRSDLELFRSGLRQRILQLQPPTE